MSATERLFYYSENVSFSTYGAEVTPEGEYRIMIPMLGFVRNILINDPRGEIEYVKFLLNTNTDSFECIQSRDGHIHFDRENYPSVHSERTATILDVIDGHETDPLIPEGICINLSKVISTTILIKFKALDEKFPFVNRCSGSVSLTLERVNIMRETTTYVPKYV